MSFMVKKNLQTQYSIKHIGILDKKPTLKAFMSFMVKKTLKPNTLLDI